MDIIFSSSHYRPKQKVSSTNAILAPIQPSDICTDNEEYVFSSINNLVIHLLPSLTRYHISPPFPFLTSHQHIFREITFGYRETPAAIANVSIPADKGTHGLRQLQAGPKASL